MISSRRHMILGVCSAALLLVVAGAYCWLLHLTHASLAGIIRDRAMTQSGQTEDIQAQHLAEIYQATAADRERLQGVFVPADHAVSFIEAIEAIGQASGSSVTLSAVSLDTADETSPGAAGTMDAHVDAQGTWASVMDALLLAESLPYASSVNDVHIATSVLGTQASKRAWDLSFDIQALVAATSSVSSPSVQ